MALADTWWGSGRKFGLGDTAVWSSVRLICTREHYAGGEAKHPWDPGYGWTLTVAATLWTPADEVEAAKLIALSSAPSEAFDGDDLTDDQLERLRAVVFCAAAPEGHHARRRLEDEAA